MSESPAEVQHRTPQEIDQEYGQACMRIGDGIVKRLSAETTEQELLKRISALNLEMIKSKAYYAQLQADLEAKKNEAAKS